MSRKARESTLWVLALLTMLQGGCWADPLPRDVVGECGPEDSSLDCCLKVNPGQWERCTGSPDPVRRPSSMATKAGVLGLGTVMVLQPVIGTGERRASNAPRWERYYKGPWEDSNQNEVYENALHVKPILVSPRLGIKTRKK